MKERGNRSGRVMVFVHVAFIAVDTRKCTQTDVVVVKQVQRVQICASLYAEHIFFPGIGDVQGISL